MIKQLFALSALLLSVSPAMADMLRHSFQHNGASRTYQLYLPFNYDKSIALPLLVALHGKNGNGQRMAELTAFNLRAQQNGFISVYPDAKNGVWNYLHGIPGATETSNDADFLAKMIERISELYAIDDRRIYVTGISNGGLMAQRLACEKNRVFAAFASVAANAYGAMPDYCHGNNTTSIIYLHGTADRLLPWQELTISNQIGNTQRITLSMKETLQFWSKRNQCGQNVSATGIKPTGSSARTKVKIYTAEDCREHSEVTLFAIIGGGHNWPGVDNFIPESIAGQVNMDIHASDVIWQFFTDKKLAQ